MPLTGVYGTYPRLQLVAGNNVTGTRKVEVLGKDIVYSAELNGGYKGMSVTIPLKEVIDYPHIFRADIPIRLQIHENENAAMLPTSVVWDGDQGQPAYTADSKALIRAYGSRSRLDEASGPLMFADDGLGSFASRDQAPFSAVQNNEHYDAKLEGMMRFTMRADSDPVIFNTGMSAGFTAYYPGSFLKGLSYRNFKQTGLNQEFAFFFFQHPNDFADNLVRRSDLGNGGPATGAIVTVLNAASRPFDQCVRIDFRPKSQWSVSKSWQAGLQELRVYGITTNDNYKGSDAFTEILTRRNMVTDGLTATTMNILPLRVARGDGHARVLDLLSIIDKRWWAIWERNAQDVYKGQYKPWAVPSAGGGRLWSVRLADLKGEGRPMPNEAGLINRARVWYQTPSQAWYTVYRDANPDPLAGTARRVNGGEPRVWMIELPNPVRTDELAQNCLTAMIEEGGVRKYSGQLRLTAAREIASETAAANSGTLKPAAIIRPGDRVRIEDDLLGTNSIYRIYGSSGTSEYMDIDLDWRSSKLEWRLARAEKKRESSRW